MYSLRFSFFIRCHSLERPAGMDDGTFQRLKEAFAMIDTDSSGEISAEELLHLLTLQVFLSILSQ
jgi:Ca2+-binding EF-hand superfamily protein